MLALTRKAGEEVVLLDAAGEIVASVCVSKVRGRYVGLAIQAEDCMGILRGELASELDPEKVAAWRRKGTDERVSKGKQKRMGREHFENRRG